MALPVKHSQRRHGAMLFRVCYAKVKVAVTKLRCKCVALTAVQLLLDEYATHSNTLLYKGTLWMKGNFYLRGG